MFERLSSGRNENDSQDQHSPDVYDNDFDAKAFREMEDIYIHLGYMTEADRMPLPPEIEFPEQGSNNQFNLNL